MHVRVIAPYATRLSRLIEQEEYDQKFAERVIRQNDLDSSGYLSTYFDTSGDDSKLYDLVINTRAMTLSKSVELITCAVDGNTIKESFQMSGTLSDLALSHKGKAALLKISKELEWINMEVEQGEATLSGIVSSPGLKNDCEKTVLNIQGIKSLDNQIRIRDINPHIS